MTRNWTRQPEVYCLFYPKHTIIITTSWLTRLGNGVDIMRDEEGNGNLQERERMGPEAKPLEKSAL